MKNKKNIERLFQEQFKDFNENPPEIVWENIQEKLQETEKKRRIIPLWLRLSGIAALFIFGILGVRSLYNLSPIPEENPIVIEKGNIPNNNILTPQENPIKQDENVSQTEKNQINETRNNSVLDEKPSFYKKPKSSSTTQIVSLDNESSKRNSTQSKKTNNSTEKEKSDLNIINQNESTAQFIISERSKTDKSLILNENNSYQINDKEQIIVQNNKLENNNSSEIKNKVNAISEDENSTNIIKEKPFELIENPLVQLKSTVDSTQNSTLVENQVEPNALEELLKEKEKEEKPEVEPKLNRWQVSTAIAPVYLGSSSNGSPIDDSFANNPKDYKSTISYGLGVNYDLNSKFSLRTGVSNLNLSYATQDVYFYPNISARGITTLSYSAQGAPINVQDFSAINEIQTVQNGAIKQQMNYVEVPFELTYKLLDKKFGIQLISGFSTLFLNDNDLMVVSEGFSAQLGEATNLNQVHFSTNVGLGFRYIFWKSFQANFEPTFKYQLNTFSSNDGGFQPYFIGLYSGVSYRF